MSTPSTSSTEKRRHPPKKKGETFSQYWQRITDGEAHAITLASRMIGVTPQSIFTSYTDTETEDESLGTNAV
jgi:hypothetical protein